MSIQVELSKFINRQINVVMTGSGGAIPGKLIEVNSAWFIMETRWSDEHYFDISKINSFWAEKEKFDSNVE